MEKSTALLMAWFLALSTSGAATLRVPVEYTTIQAAIDAADDGDTVIVASGEYVITDPLDFNRLHDPEEPASPSVKNIAVRSEEGPALTTIRRSDNLKQMERGSVVIFEKGEGPESILDGFTLRGGTGTHQFVCVATVPARCGGGILCANSSSPTILNCTVTDNTSYEYPEAGAGGGICCLDDSSPSITGCTISGNSAGDRGYGAGIACLSSSAALTDCTISGNALASAGAGVYCMGDCFEGHAALSLSNCTIAGNVASYGGGGCYCAQDASLMLTSCTISGNTASEKCGGVYAGWGATGLTLTNCIVWNNTGESIYSDDGLTAEVTYSCIESPRGWPGVGNTRADPLFWAWGTAHEVYVNAHHPEPGDGTPEHPYADLTEALRYSFVLAETSPCVGAGSDGTNMGADWGVAETPGQETRLIRCAPGVYTMRGLTLYYRASLIGSGEEETVIEGTVFGLATGAEFSDLSVTGGIHGGIYVGPDSSPALWDVTIAGNRAEPHGGGIYCGEGSSPTLTDCTIERNRADWYGGALYCKDSSPRLTDCLLAYNETVRGGAGLYCTADASPQLVNCSIIGNTSGSRGGGGVYCSGRSTPTLIGCTVRGNTTSPGTRSDGGGIRCASNAAPLLADCTITENTARSGGGICCEDQSLPALVDCTILGNVGREGIGGLACEDSSSPTVVNCIVWDNVGGSIGGTPRVAFSCIEATEEWPGEGNINEDPRLCGWGKSRDVYVDPAHPPGGDGSADDPYADITHALDYSLALAFDSPCLGAGREGSDIGADRGVCDSAGGPTRLLHLAAGTYTTAGMNLVQGVSIEGEGQDRTTVEGTIRGLRTGQVLSNLTVTGATSAGLHVTSGETPEIRNCTFSRNAGIGVFCESADPLLTDCRIAENTGGGLYCSGASPVLRDCTIINNSTRSSGGGVYCYRASPTLTRCEILESTTPAFGGGIYCRYASPTLIDCRISRNTARIGGGIACDLWSSPILRNCTLSENSADRGGAVDSWTESSPKLIGCTITNNEARDASGGSVSCKESSLSLVNCTITGTRGAGITSFSEAQVKVTNCTIAQNRRGGLYATGLCDQDGGCADFAMINCIVWGNSGESVVNYIQSGLRITYSCIDDAQIWPGQGNTNLDPLFVQPGHWDDNGTPDDTSDDVWVEGDYHLQPDSPCTDTGTSEGAPTTDIEGNGRPCGAGVDMGAYEMGGCPADDRQFMRGDSNSDGKLDVADPIHTLLYVFRGGTAPTCLDTADSNDDGAIDIADAMFILQYLFVEGPMIPPPYPRCEIDPTIDELGCSSYEPCEGQ